MKPNLRLLALLLTAAVSASAQTAVMLQNFSAVVDNNLNYFYGTWEHTGQPGSNTPNANFSQGPGYYNISGTNALADADSFLEFFFSPNRNVGTNGFLSVTALTLPSNVATSFQVTLLDANSNSAFAVFQTSWFTGQMTTVIRPVIYTGAFDGSIVDSLRISGGIPSGVPGATAVLNLQLDEVSSVATSAIPEPSTYAALAGLGAFGLVLYRRRRLAA